MSLKHIAIVMDGNGRWAKKRYLPRALGHKAGVKAAKRIVKVCGELHIEVLTLFAFSSENWQRPEEEINLLFTLFLESLQKEINELQQNNVRLKFMGDHEALPTILQEKIKTTENATEKNRGLTLVIAINYGGQWDLVQAAQRAVAQGAKNLSAENFRDYLSLGDLPDPDLLIRTSGEMRISNFLLWHLAYTELYFTETLWPDFDEAALQKAIEVYSQRKRRFGKTEEQL